MALYGPDNWGKFYPPRKKRWGLMGGVSPVEGTINQLDPNARFRKNPFPGMDDPNWSVASTYPAKTPHTPMAGKKGLSLENFVSAMGRLKQPTGTPFSSVSGRTGGSRPTAPSPRALGVDALEMASADDPRKKWWKQWQGLMGA